MKWHKTGLRSPILATVLAASAALALWLPGPALAAPELTLDACLAEALAANPDLRAAKARIKTAGHKAPQAGALPDPQLSVGYQNEGLNRYTYGNSNDAQWSAGASQAIPFPGKLAAKQNVAEKEAENVAVAYQALRLKTAERVRELYFDLSLAYVNADIIRDKADLFGRIEQAALARYAASLGSRQDVGMAQAEKYMLLERAEMYAQKIESLSAMLAATMGRRSPEGLGRPVSLGADPLPMDLEAWLAAAKNGSADIRSKDKMIEVAQAKETVAKREFLPDFTLGVGYSNKGYPLPNKDLSLPDGSSVSGGERKQFIDMWSAGVSISIPLYFWKKQSEGLKEARSALNEAKYEREAAETMTLGSIRESYAMLKSAEKLAALYKSGLIPKARQDFDLALAAYAGGKTESASVAGKLKNILDFEREYATALAEREKARARLLRLTGQGLPGESPAMVQAAPEQAKTPPEQSHDAPEKAKSASRRAKAAATE
jgi:outer membrane protein, heavy metal efflux system